MVPYKQGSVQAPRRNQFQNQPMVIYKPRNFQRNIPQRAPQEINYVDLPGAVYPMNLTGGIALIAIIPQGVGVSQRIGKRAYYKSLLIRGFIAAGSTGIITDTTYMIVYDKRPTGVLPAITDILTSVNTNAFQNDNNTGRFEVIRRSDQVVVGNSTTPTTGLEAINVDHFIKLKKDLLLLKV